MKEKTKAGLMIGGGLSLLVVGAVSLSYAFISVSDKQSSPNAFTSGCLNIAIENESSAINLVNTYPITDLEGLESTGYTFTVKNTCSTSTKYQINLESLNETTNTLNTQYIKTSLSSDTMDNLIQKLDSSKVVQAYIDNAYVAHNLYKGEIAGNSSKEFKLRLWMDYDTTKEQGANKVYTSKINVIANPDLEITNIPEIKTTLVDNTLEGTITNMKESEPKKVYFDNVINDEMYPFSYNESTGEYTSTNKEDVSTIVFRPTTNIDNLGICYNVSTNPDLGGAKLYLYEDDFMLIAGNEKKCVPIGDVNPSSGIEIEFYGYEGTESINDKKEISFYFVELEGLNYCASNGNKCEPNTNAAIADNKVYISTYNLNTSIIVATTLGNINVNNDGKSIICVALDSGKTYCSNTFVKPNRDFSRKALTDEGVYATNDGMYGGTSYYWRGAVTNNYVKFAGFCWRIVRINGDGSIRLIYDGTTCHANGTSTADSIVKANVAYNLSSNQSNYVGWTYEGTSQRPINNTIATASNAKAQLESWYSSTIGNNTTYTAKIVDGKYCNDRNVQNGSIWAIDGILFDYAAYSRIKNIYQPTLSCPSGDVYTLKVGLITADEVMYAGGNDEDGRDNDKYYLYNGQNYWTMSPSIWSGAGVFYVRNYGRLSDSMVVNTYGLRPVINLRSDIQFQAGGNGTLDNPYVVI